MTYDPFQDPALDDPADDFRPRRPLRPIKPPKDHSPTAIVPEEVFEAETRKVDDTGRRVMSPMARLALDEAREALHLSTLPNGWTDETGTGEAS